MAFTFFFRDAETIKTAVDLLADASSGRSCVRVWEAGCAMGPETFTLAIILAEKLGGFAFRNLWIHATDAEEDPSFGSTIAAGVYPWDEIKRIPDDLRRKYFEPQGQPGCYRVDPRLAGRVRYERHDLLTLRPIGAGFSMVMCKNVLLHFSPAQRIDVLRMFHEALAPGGILVMERTQVLPEAVAHLFSRAAPESQVFSRN